MFINFYKKYALVISIVFCILTYSALSQNSPEVITLDEAIGIGISNNHSLVLSKLEIDISRARVREAKSDYYPQIDSKIVVPFVERESGFFLDQLIWDFGRTSNIVKATKYQLEASKYNMDQKLRETVQDTTIAYYNALINKNFLISAEKSLKKQELIVQKTEELNKIGRTSNIDLTRTKSDLGEAKLELHRQKNSFTVSKLELINVIGGEFSKDIELVDEEEITIKDYNLEYITTKTINNSAELKRVDSEFHASRANANAEKSEFYPLIFGRVAYRFEGEGGEDFPAFIAGFGFQFPLFEGFARFARLDIREAESTRSQIEYERTKKEIQTEIEKIFLDLEFSKQRIEITRSNREISKNHLNLIKERYKLGTASRIEVVDAELFFAESNSKYLESIYNYKINETKLLAFTGEI